MHWPRFDSPVLASLRPVIAASRDVVTDADKLREHAGWLALENFDFDFDLGLPQFVQPSGSGDDPDQAFDFLLVATSVNFAFTDFHTRVRFDVDYGGRRWCDSDALHACLRRALDEGRPVLDGAWLAALTRGELADVFRGESELPLLDERLEIWRSVGRTLCQRYGGRFRHFVRGGPLRVYAGGDGLLERLVREFPRFNDVSFYDGHEVRFHKLAQLALWLLYCALRPSGAFALPDVGRLTAFADYIVPLALRVMNVLRYSAELDDAIQAGRIVPRDSPWEVEIRAHTLYATALLCEEVNARRPPDRQVIVPQIDARLWTHYHKTFAPHHLTPTVMY